MRVGPPAKRNVHVIINTDSRPLDYIGIYQWACVGDTQHDRNMSIFCFYCSSNLSDSGEIEWVRPLIARASLGIYTHRDTHVHNENLQY